MSCVIVPESLDKAINKKLDEMIAEQPDAAIERAHLYRKILAAYDMFGYIPDMSLRKIEQ